jgi:hypothetical protein
MSNKNPLIRHYKPEDRQSIRDICAETGLWGEPIDSFFQDRALFSELIVDPYLRF